MLEALFSVTCSLDSGFSLTSVVMVLSAECNPDLRTDAASARLT